MTKAKLNKLTKRSQLSMKAQLPAQYKGTVIRTRSAMWEIIKKYPAREQSELQRVNSEARHAINFRLQQFQYSCIRHLNPSLRTKQLIAQHNSLVAELRDSIRADYAAYKAMTLAARARKSDAS